MSATNNGRSPRSVALVGPYSSGKSTLFEALLDAAGSPVKRPADPRNRPMTTEIRLQPSANNSGGVDLDFEGIRHGNDENEAEEKIIVRG